MIEEDLAGAVSEEEEMYKENILDHYKHPHNKREIKGAAIHCHDLNPLCGDELTLYLVVDKSGNSITDVAFTGHGCAISQASISLLTDELKGKSLNEARNIGQERIMELLGIKISHTRMKCALLSLKVLQGGLTQCSM